MAERPGTLQGPTRRDDGTSWPKSRGVAFAVLTRAVMIDHTIADLHASPGAIQDALLMQYRETLRQADHILAEVERNLPSVDPDVIVREAPVMVAARTNIDAVIDYVLAALASPGTATPRARATD